MKGFVWLLVLLLAPPASGMSVLVDYEAVRLAGKLYPGTEALVAAIRQHENGRVPLHSCGHKSGWLYPNTAPAKFYPASQRQYIECARSVSRFTLDYVMTGNAENYWDYLARRYCGNPVALKDWAKCVRFLYLKEVRQKKWLGGKK